MSDFLKPDTGELALGDSGFLRGGMSEAEVLASGVPFVREYHSGAGWLTKSLEPRPLRQHLAYYTLTFKEDELAQVSISFIEDPARDAHSMQVEYRHFLQEELQLPAASTHDGLTVTYGFPWGEVTATYDPRNDTSAIHVAWK